MSIRYPKVPSRPTYLPCDQRRQRRAAEQQRRADFARMNVAIAQRLKTVT
jgi:hypothetical protein